MIRLQKIASDISEKREFVYSVPVTPKIKGETPIYRKVSHKNGLLRIPSNITSLADIWHQTLSQYPNNKLVEDLTAVEVDKEVKKVGSWLTKNNHKTMFMYCKNSPRWTFVDIACWNYGLLNVPLYDTLGEEAFHHILKITEGTLLFTTSDLFTNLINYLSKSKANLKEVIFFDKVGEKEVKALADLGVKVVPFEKLLTQPVLPQPKLSLDT